MKNWADILKNLTILTQFGLSFITPLLLCLALSWWLTENSISAPGLHPRLFLRARRFGMVAYKLYLSVTSHQKKERKKTKQHISFNNHH